MLGVTKRSAVFYPHSHTGMYLKEPGLPVFPTNGWSGQQTEADLALAEFIDATGGDPGISAHKEKLVTQLKELAVKHGMPLTNAEVDAAYSLPVEELHEYLAHSTDTKSAPITKEEELRQHQNYVISLLPGKIQHWMRHYVVYVGTPFSVLLTAMLVVLLTPDSWLWLGTLIGGVFGLPLVLAVFGLSTLPIMAVIFFFMQRAVKNPVYADCWYGPIIGLVWFVSVGILGLIDPWNLPMWSTILTCSVSGVGTAGMVVLTYTEPSF